MEGEVCANLIDFYLENQYYIILEILSHLKLSLTNSNYIILNLISVMNVILDWFTSVWWGPWARPWEFTGL
jgi:hypothetical protein